MFIAPLDLKIISTMTSKEKKQKEREEKLLSTYGSTPLTDTSYLDTPFFEKTESMYRDQNNFVDSIVNSPAYRSAYELFSQSSETIWLERLKMIPYQFSVPEYSFADAFTNNRRDKIGQAYADAMSAIQQLVADYHVHNNSLPITQVAQEKLAGVSSGITGTGLEPSSVPSGQQFSSASSMPSASPIGTFATAFGILTASVGGVASAISALKSFASFKKTNKEADYIDFRKIIESGQLGVQLKQLGISEGQFLNSQNSALQSVLGELMNRGFVDVPKFDSWDSFNNWWNKDGKIQANSLFMGNNRRMQLYSSLEDLYYTKLGDSLYDVNESGFNYANDALTALTNAVVNSRLVTFKFELDYQRAKAEYDALYQLALDPEALAKAYTDKSVYDAELSNLSTKLKGLEAKRANMAFEQISSWYSAAGDDPMARAALAQVMQGINVSDLMLMDSYNFNRHLNNAVGVINPITDMVNAGANLTDAILPF